MSDHPIPPAPLPPAAEAPYPARLAPQEAIEPPAPSAEEAAPAAGAGLGPMGLTLIGGAMAAVGLAIALPFLRRRKPDSGDTSDALPKRRPRAASRPKKDG